MFSENTLMLYQQDLQLVSYFVKALALMLGADITFLAFWRCKNIDSSFQLDPYTPAI